MFNPASYVGIHSLDVCRHMFTWLGSLFILSFIPSKTPFYMSRLIWNSGWLSRGRCYESSGGPFSCEILKFKWNFSWIWPMWASILHVKFHLKFQVKFRMKLANLGFHTVEFQAKFHMKYGSPGRSTSCEISLEISLENGPPELSYKI